VGSRTRSLCRWPPRRCDAHPMRDVFLGTGRIYYINCLMFTSNLTKKLWKKMEVQPSLCKIMVLPVDLVAGDRSHLQLEADLLPDDSSS
jgi:hypothetical protein